MRYNRKNVEVVDLVARTLRPDVFHWTKENYDADLARRRLGPILAEQERLKGIVREVLLATEKIGCRVITLDEMTDDVLVKYLNHTTPLFPYIDSHSRFYKKVFVRRRKQAKITDDGLVGVMEIGDEEQ